MKAFYQIDGVNENFRTLNAAKFHVYVAYTERERIKELTNTVISKIHNDNVTTITPINIDENGNYSFGKTKKTVKTK